jgi:hypothetical protein
MEKEDFRQQAVEVMEKLEQQKHELEAQLRSVIAQIAGLKMYVHGAHLSAAQLKESWPLFFNTQIKSGQKILSSSKNSHSKSRQLQNSKASEQAESYSQKTFLDQQERAKGEKIKAILKVIASAEPNGATFADLLSGARAIGVDLNPDATRSQLAKAKRKGWVLKVGDKYKLGAVTRTN